MSLRFARNNQPQGLVVRLHQFPWLVVAVAVAVGFRLSSPVMADLSFIVLAFIALCGRAQAIQALALSWLFSMLSTGIAPQPEFASLGRYAVIAGALVSVIVRARGQRSASGLHVHKLVLFTLFVGLGIAIHSVFFSALPDISLLRAFLWTAVIVVLILAWSGLNHTDRRRLELQLFGGLSFLVLLSLPLMFSEVGYLVNGSGFQGVLNHPQAFGLSLAVLAAWIGGKIIGERNQSWPLLLLFGLCLIMLYETEARTAGLGLVVGIVSAALIGWLISGRGFLGYFYGLREARLHIALVGCFLAALPLAPLVQDHFGGFIQKRGDTGSLIEIYFDSRGVALEPMLDNIETDPLRGIGFGIASDPNAMEIARDPVLGLPVGAPIEKGNVFIAILEELGLFGFLIVMWWVALLVRRSAKGDIAPFAVCLTVLSLNLGEATLFSPGGMGMLMLIFLMWASTSRGRMNNSAMKLDNAVRLPG